MGVEHLGADSVRSPHVPPLPPHHPGAAPALISPGLDRQRLTRAKRRQLRSAEPGSDVHAWRPTRPVRQPKKENPRPDPRCRPALSNRGRQCHARIQVGAARRAGSSSQRPMAGSPGPEPAVCVPPPDPIMNQASRSQDYGSSKGLDGPADRFARPCRLQRPIVKIGGPSG